MAVKKPETTEVLAPVAMEAHELFCAKVSQSVEADWPALVAEEVLRIRQSAGQGYTPDRIAAIRGDLERYCERVREYRDARG